jgi:hypothetical protein
MKQQTNNNKDKGGNMKTLKRTTKFQLVRDGELVNTVYDLAREARDIGEQLIVCGWIKTYQVIPIKAVWLKVT